MVSDRNRQIIERRRSGESFSAIGTALGISRERVREIVEREERRDRRARELEEAARLAQQPNPLQLPPRLRNMLAKLFGTPDFTPDDVVALEYSAAMFWTIPNFGLRDWKELKMWMERAGKSPAYQLGSGSQRSHDSR
jgi:sigma-70-like protein